jgi:hypothetical protein
VVGKGTSTGNGATRGAFRAWSRGPSGPGGILNEWSGDRKGPCKCVARSRLPRADRNAGCEVGNSRRRLASRDKTAVASNPVSMDLAVVDRWAARTGGPHPGRTRSQITSPEKTRVRLCWGDSQKSRPGVEQPPIPGCASRACISPGLACWHCLRVRQAEVGACHAPESAIRSLHFVARRHCRC